MKLLIATALFALLPLCASAQETAAFLKIDVGARALGMGGAYTGVADDVNAIAWNPAGLSGLKSRELGFMHAELFANTRYDFFGYAQPAKKGVFAGSVRYLSQGKLDGRDSMGRPTGGFSASDSAVDLAYGSRYGESMLLGGGIKFIRSSIAEVSAQSYAADLGAMYQLGRVGPGATQLGLAVMNLGPGMKFLDERSPLPLALAAGLGYRLPAGLTVAVDFRNRPYSKTNEVCVGTEYSLGAGFALRAGYASAGAQARGGSGASAVKGLAGGFGFRAYGANLDYSITPFGELGNAHRFSLGARF